MRPSIALLLALLFTATTQLVAQPPKTDPKAEAKVDPKNDDPIAAQLLKDKEVYAAALEKARDGMLKAFDKQHESVKNNKSLKIEVQLAKLEAFEAEKKAFEETGAPPVSIEFRTAVSDYRAALKKAETACKTAFEKAAKAYRDKGELKEASTVIEEMKEVLATAANLAAPPMVIRCGNATSLVFGLKGGKTDDGTHVVTAEYAKGDQTMLWRKISVGDGWYYIENVKTGLVMTASGKQNQSEVIIAKKESPASELQLWKFVAVPQFRDTVKIVPKGVGRPLDVYMRSKTPGGSVVIWDDANENHRYFGFFPPK